MNVHLPKPLYGWRAFVGEVGIIVIGVLIALAAQKLVERVSSRGRAVQAEGRIRSELRTTLGNEVERIAIHSCLTGRLRELAIGLATGRTSWPPPPEVAYPGLPKRALAMMYNAPARVWNTDAYDEALAQGDLREVSRDRRSGLATLYTQIKSVRELNDEEQRLRATLGPLQFNPSLSSAERNALIATLARLDQINGLIVLVSRQTFERFRSLSYTDTPQEVAEFHRARVWENTLADLRRRFGSCVNPGAVAELNPALVPIAPE
jgi:hypothetical protein